MSNATDQAELEEWLLDVTCYPSTEAIAFVPIRGKEIVWGMSVLRERAPGPLAGVVSQNGLDHVLEWVSEHPNWRVDHCSAEALRDA